MLIEFSVANFRSLKHRQTFSLAKSVGSELVGTNTFKTQAAQDFYLLKSAAVYGPNAGGKSNFIKAMRAMRDIVSESATSYRRGDKIPVTPFRLARETANQPTEFEVVFIVDQVRYQYGFTVSEEKVFEEWLLAYPKGRPQRWVARSWNETKQRYDWELGDKLFGEKQLWQKSTRDNALFLSTAVHLNSEQLQPVYDWFDDTLRVANIAGWNPAFTASLCETEEKKQVLNFLRAADINIDDIVVDKSELDIKTLPSDMPEQLKSVLVDEMKGKEILDIKTVHRNTNGDSVTFDFEEESDGTKKLFSFAGPWIDSLENGYVLFIDELHDNLHPHLVQFLVKLFNSEKTNPKNAQLVFTTHETSILSQDVFRRDQIWFCEKDLDQASNLFPLTDFSPHKGRVNLELAYLSGRYGAVPYTRSFNEIN